MKFDIFGHTLVMQCYIHTKKEKEKCREASLREAKRIEAINKKKREKSIKSFEKKVEKVCEEKSYRFTIHAKQRIHERFGHEEVFVAEAYDDIVENIDSAVQFKGLDCCIKGNLGYYIISPDGFVKTAVRSRPKGYDSKIGYCPFKLAKLKRYFK